MYKGFDLKIEESFFDKKYYFIGIDQYNEIKNIIERDIGEYMKKDGSLDGDKISKTWFPEVNADIFISHSHTDESLAIKFAGWLYENFGLISFIDSCVWGYSDDLLLDIDRRYCYDNFTNTYRYKDRNFSTSHVHMMLSTSLMSMIDKCECIIFLNTDNSIQTADEVIADTTHSPWIFSELETTKLIRKRPISDYREESIEKRALQESFQYYNQLRIGYRGSRKHLISLDDISLNIWNNYAKKYNHSNPLDLLYNLTCK